MSLQYSVSVNNARLDSIETTAGTAAKLRLYTGSAPANCAASEAGTLLVEMVLPTDWMSNAASGVKAKTGTWSGTAVATGTAAHFRIYDSAGTTCHLQGTAGTSGTDMILDNASIATSQTVTCNTFSLTASNA
jgi:hypothetical protein